MHAGKVGMMLSIIKTSNRGTCTEEIVTHSVYKHFGRGFPGAYFLPQVAVVSCQKAHWLEDHEQHHKNCTYFIRIDHGETFHVLHFTKPLVFLLPSGVQDPSHVLTFASRENIEVIHHATENQLLKKISFCSARLPEISLAAYKVLGYPPHHENKLAQAGISVRPRRIIRDTIAFPAEERWEVI